MIDSGAGGECPICAASVIWVSSHNGKAIALEERPGRIAIQAGLGRPAEAVRVSSATRWKQHHCPGRREARPS